MDIDKNKKVKLLCKTEENKQKTIQIIEQEGKNLDDYEIIVDEELWNKYQKQHTYLFYKKPDISELKNVIKDISGWAKQQDRQQKKYQKEQQKFAKRFYRHK